MSFYCYHCPTWSRWGKRGKSGSFAALPRFGSSSQTAWNQLEQDDQLSVIVKIFSRSSWEQAKCLCNKLKSDLRCFEPTQAMLFLKILKLFWLRWSIVTFFQWQFFGTGRLHLYLLLPFATNDNLDMEANLQYDFWIAGWLANNQQTKCRYKLSPKQFTHEVHAYNGRCWTFLIEATSRQHGMGDKPLRLSSSHSTFLSQHHNWMMGQHICSPIIHR